jgi:hypothetical protein
MGISSVVLLILWPNSSCINRQPVPAFKAGEQNHQTLPGITYDAGFNSKATFNTNEIYIICQYFINLIPNAFGSLCRWRPLL